NVRRDLSTSYISASLMDLSVICAVRHVFVLTDVVWRARVSGMYPRCGGTSQMTRTDCRWSFEPSRPFCAGHGNATAISPERELECPAYCRGSHKGTSHGIRSQQTRFVDSLS